MTALDAIGDVARLGTAIADAARRDPVVWRARYLRRVARAYGLALAQADRARGRQRDAAMARARAALAALRGLVDDDEIAALGLPASLD